MKTRASLALIFALVAGAGGWAAGPIKIPVSPTPTPAEAPRIEGLTIPRGDGFLGLELVNGNFKLSFYDAQKKPVAPDVTRAAFRWPVVYRLLDEHALLTLAPDGKSLTSPKAIKGPYHFKLYISLLRNEETEDKAAENIVVDFHWPASVGAPTDASP